MGSMDVLKDMPEAEDRAATLRELQARLEALLKPKLQEVREAIALRKCYSCCCAPVFELERTFSHRVCYQPGHFGVEHKVLPHR